MRVTNSIITARSQLRLQQGLQGIDRVRDDIATGVRIRKMSDDATSGGELVRIGSSMRALTQYRRNANNGINRAQAEEGALNLLGNALTRASELGISQSTGTANAQSRLLVRREVDQLINLAANLGNTRFGDEYLFGGFRAGEAPFRTPAPASGSFSRLTDTSDNPVNPSGNITLEVGDGKFVTPNHNATQVFIDTDALDALRALSTALGANDPVAIQAAADRITTANSNVQALLGTQGARINEMEGAKTSLDSLEFDLKAFRSDLRDTEIDKAMVELVGKQTLYQAAMSATSRILGLSLANYL
ncbi:flagellin [Gemmatimonas sp.]|jgi:flagellar hook-associated protein 3 FlgL|uniref:flagellin N-terminal helical domain-containing protein n=1 Tax=Gemmatimonas sp. TaxID=1962908 RepID=UPI0037BFE4D5